MAQCSVRENYRRFFDDLAQYICQHHPNLCFFGYGSCFNNKLDPPADLDGGIIMPDVITDKKAVLDVSARLSHLLKERGISEQRVQINLLDRISGGDGRFLSYDPTYVEYLKKWGVVLSGPDFIKDLKGLDNKVGELNSIAFNFRGIRNDFLMLYSFSDDKRSKKLLKAIGLLESHPKKIGILRIYSEIEGNKKYGVVADELKKKNKTQFVNDLKSMFPEVDLFLFDQSCAFKPQDFSGSIEEVAEIFSRALQTYEQIIKSYIERFPPTKRTVESII